jgi:hypothetical protein
MNSAVSAFAGTNSNRTLEGRLPRIFSTAIPIIGNRYPLFRFSFFSP